LEDNALPTNTTCTAANAADAAKISVLVAFDINASTKEKTAVNITTRPSRRLVFLTKLRMIIGIVVSKEASRVANLSPIEMI